MELALANIISNLLVLLFKSLHGDMDKFFSSVQTFLVLFWRKWDQLWGEMQISRSCGLSCNIGSVGGQERVSCSDEEMRDMMERVGMVCGLEGISGSLSGEELLSLFEEEEPSLEEIRESFGVFDVNNDGFIDCSELQRVVCSLGLKEGCELEDCKKMIKAFDGNGDGLIDFQDFVKLMESCLC
ncbi:putative calcium-binding protein CML46 [Sesamum alatum]|uniref:Calcium-binding protein CML46 n=1 Tax=Sesamum alatum TaxID=300844 RepID=A0AAE2CPT7_9LAMI|nr:putative calcium-binding protein CML46 [Sesamum alatum]